MTINRERPSETGGLSSFISNVIKVSLVTVFVVTAGYGCAYFNTYYTAQKNFKDGERNFSRDGDTKGQNTTKYYNEAIERAVEVIRDFPDSRYVDDSFYIIGTSWFRLGDYSRARSQLDNLLTNFPESEFVPEAKYIKARCLVKTYEFDEAGMLLRELMKSDDRRMRGRAGLVMAEIAYTDKNWEELLTAAQAVIDADPERDEMNRAVLYRAQALFHLERYEDAVTALDDLLDRKLDTDVRFDANLTMALSKAKLGEYAEGFAYLDEMQGKGEFLEYAPRIQLEIGTINEYEGKTEDAIQVYRNLAGDFPDSVQAKQAWYRVGKLLLEDLDNIDEAKTAFDNVKLGKGKATALWVSEAQTLSTQIDSLKSKLEMIDKFEDDPERRAYYRFAVAELYNFSFARPDSAASQYRAIISELPGSDFAVRSEYFLGMFDLKEQGTFNDETDRELMRSLVEKYPDSKFAGELKVHLGISDRPPELELFSAAEQARLNGEGPDVYLPLYRKVMDEYPGSKSAFRAQYAIAYFTEHDVGDREKALELYTVLAELEPNVFNQDFVSLAEDKLEFAEEEPKLLEDITKRIVYMTYGTGRQSRDEEEEGDEPSATVADGAQPSPEGEVLTGYRKIRARNAGIRSRYYTD